MIYVTPLDNETNLGTSASVNSGFTTLAEAVAIMGPNYERLTKIFLVYRSEPQSTVFSTIAIR